jgi:hypothetical protein
LQQDGEVIKVYINPSVDELSEDVKQLISTVTTQESELETAQNIE